MTGRPRAAVGALPAYRPGKAAAQAEAVGFERWKRPVLARFLPGTRLRFARAAAPGAALVNGYGPTENTTFTACHGMTSAADLARPVPIGMRSTLRIGATSVAVPVKNSSSAV